MPIRISLRDGSGRGGRRTPRATRIVDSLAAVAEFAGVTVQSASAWFERGAPVLPDGRYDLWEIARWHADNIAGRVSAGAVEPGYQDDDEDDAPDAPDGQPSDWRIRRMRADALAAELRLNEATRAVIPRTEHERSQVELVASFVSALDNMPPKVIPLLLGARTYTEFETVLRDHIRAMRIQLVAKHSAPGTSVGARDA